MIGPRRLGWPASRNTAFNPILVSVDKDPVSRRDMVIPPPVTFEIDQAFRLI